jgi:Uncharacterized conserved protein (DUF2190)
MATTKIDPRDLETLPAAADLSEKQFFLVKITEAGTITLAGVGDIAFPLQDTPKQGQNGTFAVAGRCKAVSGTNIKAGVFVSAGANGKVVEATPEVITAEKVATRGTRAIGISLEAGASGDVVAYRQIIPTGRA